MGTTATDLAATDLAGSDKGARIAEHPAPGTWAIDPAHTTIEFVARHLVVTKVRGRFDRFEGAIHVDEDPLRSWAEATIDATSVHTGTQMRDDHLRNSEFFDVEGHPRIVARVRDLEPVEEGRFRATADLTVRDVTREIPLDVEYFGVVEHPDGNLRAAFSARGTIDLEDFGIVYNQTFVGRKVDIDITALSVRQ